MRPDPRSFANASTCRLEAPRADPPSRRSRLPDAPRRCSHTIYVNRTARKTSSVRRHTEINNELARRICRDLQVRRQACREAVAQHPTGAAIQRPTAKLPALYRRCLSAPWSEVTQHPTREAFEHPAGILPALYGEVSILSEVGSALRRSSPALCFAVTALAVICTTRHDDMHADNAHPRRGAD